MSLAFIVTYFCLVADVCKRSHEIQRKTTTKTLFGSKHSLIILAMAPERFKTSGAHAANITQYLLGKALQAKREGVSPLEADFSFETFKTESPSILEAIARDHPGKTGDKYRIARDNYKRQVKRFTKWLVNGGGKWQMVLFYIDCCV